MSKKIKMRLGDSPSGEKESFLQEQIKDESIEKAMSKLLDSIQISNANGIVNIALPEPALQIILGLLSQIQNILQQSLGKTQGRER